MKSKIYLLLLSVFALTYSFDSYAITGKWRGELSINSYKLPLVFNFKEDIAGKITATMDSPQQNAKDIPLVINYLSSDSINLECKLIGAVYSGKIIDKKIEGIFTQQGFRLPLILTPEQPVSERRPQTPQPPFPYLEKDTVFTSVDGVRLAGTLTYPQNMIKGKTPVVIMITGSGPQNRDEEIFEHRPFAVIADFLARNGIASFRYDDRGVAESKGNYATSTIDTFLFDANCALGFVKGMKEFGKTGIIGHSEGGTLAVLSAAECTPDFIITLAGMVTPSKETLLEQNIRLLDQAGIKGSQRESSISLIRSLYDEIIRQVKTGKTGPIDIDKLCKDNSLDVPGMIVESVKRNFAARNGYFDSLVCLDPTDALKKIKCPVLAINGSKDTQVNPDTNLEAFRRNVKNVDIRRMEGLNHLMQHATTGEVSEYNDITETISPEVLQIISDFILHLK